MKAALFRCLECGTEYDPDTFAVGETPSCVDVCEATDNSDAAAIPAMVPVTVGDLLAEGGPR